MRGANTVPDSFEQREGRMATPHRADHVGSFLRPAELLEARHAGASPERLRVIEDQHILRVLAKQKELGLDVFSDGELRRRNFMSDLIDAVHGFDTGEAVARSWHGTAGVAGSNGTGGVTPRVRPRGRMKAHELAFLRAHPPRAIKINPPPADPVSATS